MISLQSPMLTWSPASSDGNADLRKHVAEFEGMFLSQILEKLKDSYHMPGEEETDSAGESFQSLANSSLGNSLAQKDGMGITNLLVQSLTGYHVKTGAGSADVVVETKRKD